MSRVTAEIPTPIGSLWVAGDAYAVTELSWEPLAGPVHRGELAWFVTPLADYLFRGGRTFPGGLAFESDRPVWSKEPRTGRAETFTHKVLHAMVRIPYGRTISYGGLGQELGNRYLARAVGNACASNPLPIVIPCHRVVGAHSLGGYTGGLDKKRYLLALEKAKILEDPF